MSKRTQSKEQIDEFYLAHEDPWGYFSSDHDRLRKDVLIAELSGHVIGRALDIGCGNGFITESIPASAVVGVDISTAAIQEATRRSKSVSVEYLAGSLFDLPTLELGKFDAVFITGVLYDQYIGNSLPLIYQIIDDLLAEDGILVSVHIDSWYLARFPYPVIRETRYRYGKYFHLLEIYRK